MSNEPLVERLRKLLAHATPGPWCVYSEPDVGLPPSLFAGRVGETGFGPIEPLTGVDLDLVAEAVNALPELLDRIQSLEASERRLREALADAREAIASLDEDALGVDDRQNYLCDPHPPYPLRDELLAKIDAALGEQP